MSEKRNKLYRHRVRDNATRENKQEIPVERRYRHELPDEFGIVSRGPFNIIILFFY